MFLPRIGSVFECPLRGPDFGVREGCHTFFSDLKDDVHANNRTWLAVRRLHGPVGVQLCKRCLYCRVCCPCVEPEFKEELTADIESRKLDFDQ